MDLRREGEMDVVLVRARRDGKEDQDRRGELVPSQLLPHREAGEPLSSSRRFIPFAVVYEPQADPLVLFDFDRDGSLGCIERLPLLYHPTEPGTVFRTLTVRWSGDGGPDRQQRYRLSLPHRLPEGERALYRVELVDVPAARHHQDGKETRFFLYDGNHDGLFDGRPGDALLIADAEAKSVSLDPTGSQLASLHLPVELPWGVYEVDRLDPAGPSLLLRRSGAAAARSDPGEIPAPVECPGLGAPAVTVGGAGDQLQLVYFWLSGCGTCASEIERLDQLLAAAGAPPVRAVGVSLDEDRETAERFVARHRPSFPQCFAGATLWDNPVAARLGVYQPSSVVLLGKDGRVLRRVRGVEAAWEALRDLL